jgi:NAD(P)-dependent dehydrogenase (short-subunit alcohol dehydrogenase family)
MLATEAFDLTGAVVWVTGSSRGIGLGIARHLHAHGATVVLHGRDASGLALVVDDLGSRADAVTADVRDPASLEAAVAEIASRHGRLDMLVCNVGGAQMAQLSDMDPTIWAKMIDLNLSGAYLPARASYDLLKQSDRGSVVLISATAATNPAPGFGAYGAAKAAVEHLVRSLAAEWGPNVRVNGVSPGLIRTSGSMKALFGDSEELVAKAGSAMAMRRVGEPEDVAWAVHFLLSAAASYISGSVLAVDGGPIEGVAQRVMRAMK